MKNSIASKKDDFNFSKIVNFIKKLYKTNEFIPLHEPRFPGNEKKYVNETIDSTFVSSVGKFVDSFELNFAEYTGTKKAVAVVNGTQALLISLLTSGANPETEILTQGLTFVATANAIKYTGAEPVFLDVDKDTLGLSPDSVKNFIKTNCTKKDNKLYNNSTGKQIIACLPMHTFGHPCRIEELSEICTENNLILIEDAAEAVGSFYKNKHLGSYGKLGVFSFNGNKIITTGGGGMVVTNNLELGKRIKHLTTTAKQPHPWNFYHDQLGYNFRMPNINAALGVAQLENIENFISKKRELSETYKNFFKEEKIEFFVEPEHSKSNYWLNAILLQNKATRDDFLKITNENGVMTRPIWNLMTELPMYSKCQNDGLENSRYLSERIVNIPSSVIL